MLYERIGDAAAASALEGDVAFDPWWPARAGRHGA